MRYGSLLIIALLLAACSEDAPNQPVPAAPTLTIEVLTSAPEMGQPVEFRASVTGVTLTAPVYEWDFGDGGADTLSSAEIQHTYTDGGTFTVKLRVIDTVANFAGEDSATLTVVDNRPVWHHWNTVVVTLYATQHGFEGSWYPGEPKIRENYRYTLQQNRIEDMPWSGTRVDYTRNSNIGSEYTTEKFQVRLSTDGRMIDTVYVYYYWVFEPGGKPYSSSNNWIKSTGLKVQGDILRSGATYRVEGPTTVQHVIGFSDHSWSRMNNYVNYDSLAVTPDMYIEVRFYNM